MIGGPKLMVHFSDGALSELVIENLITGAVARKLRASQVVAAFRASQPERAFIVDCNPYVGTVLGVDASAPATLLIDWFEASYYPAVECPSPEWYERDMHKSDLILLPSMMRGDASRLQILRESAPLFRLPSDCLDEPEIPEDKWFACIDGGIEGREDIAGHVVGQGGEAVILNDAGPRSLANLSRARYFIGGDAALLALAGAFAVPCAAVGVTGNSRAAWRQGDIVVDEKNPDLPDVADRLFEATGDCPAWRQPEEGTPAAPSDGIRFPLELADD